VLERERNNLRGPVKACVEESTYPGPTPDAGEQIPENKNWYKTEYDIDGHLLARRIPNSDGSEWVTQYTYGTSGNLLKIASGKEGEPPAESIYSYDDQGRLLSIGANRTPDNPVTFHYVERGRKTSVQVSSPTDYRPDVVVAGNPFEVADRAPNLQGGGTAITVYDEHDRPTEVQVRDAQGELMSRAVRVYDEHGRVTEERQILDDPVSGRDTGKYSGGFGRLARRAARAIGQAHGRARRAVLDRLQLRQTGPRTADSPANLQ
jgi:hypothetical protein